ncbi:zinc finger RNA-binding protein-like isoform X2 [Panonychus citri]|uniref:zinc finger RNA-binding protein-like isoform X2 n=1 Tax=Panonychus citri TaxID=50023 RepID=UPI002306FD0C|nr:zinc finger RNA-binding protein-like isoform X2 [Panonychus citri]
MTSNNYYGFTHGGNTYGSGYISAPNMAQGGFSGHGPVASSYSAAPRASTYDQNFATTGAAMATNYGYARPSVGHSRSFFQAPAAVAYPTDANQYSAANPTSTMYPYTGNSSSYTNTYNSVVTNYAASALYSQQATVAQHDNSSTAAYTSGKQGNWNFKKTLKGNKMKTTPKVQQLHYCEVCKISCAGPQTYKEHLDGQKHKKKEAQMKTGTAITPNKRGQPVGVSLRCELCDVTCTGNDAYAAHIRGSKHQKVLKLHTKLVLGTPKINFLSGGRLHTTNTPIIPPGVTLSNTTPEAESQPLNEDPMPQESSNYQPPSTPIVPNTSSSSVAPQFTSPSPPNSTFVITTDPNLMDYEKSDSQPVGQDYIEEHRSDDSKTVSFHCKLCDCRFNDPNAKEMHLKGRRHRLQYKKKVDPNLVVDIKPSLKQRKIQETKDKRFFHNKQRDHHYWNDWYPPPNRGMGMGGIAYGYMPPPPPPPPHMMPPSGFGGPAGPGGLLMGPLPFRGRGGHSGGSWDDNHLIQKHSEICPSENELDEIHHVVMVTERALAGVYDKLSKEDNQNAINEIIQKELKEEFSNVTEGQMVTNPSESTTETINNNSTATKDENQEELPKQTESCTNENANKEEKTTNGSNCETTNDKNDENNSNRILRGLMRVGPLAKNLLLVGDKEVDLVIICSDKPTNQLVMRVMNHLPKQLELVNPTDKYEIHVKIGEGKISITSTSELPITVNVHFTSPSIRESSAPEVIAPAEMVKEPKQILDRQKCLDALAALRHAKWYQARVSNLHPCPMIIRLIRDLCRRLPTWSKLDLWAVELLCERVISSAGEQLNPGEAFRHVLEAIASGLLLPGGAGLMDPCEKEPTDALANLTRQEREDITSSAQHALRLIAFRQIHKILGVEPMQSRPRKRRLDSEHEESNTLEGDNDNKKDKKESVWTEEDAHTSACEENSQKIPKSEGTIESSLTSTSP